MRRKVRNADAILARLGTRAKGVVTREELLEAGVTDGAIVQRRRSGALIAEYRGVYRVGHAAPSVEATYLAAVKACGKGSGLSGGAAAWWWSLIRGRPPPPEVSAPTARRIPGLETRRRRLYPSELTTHRGIPITSVALTLIDIAPLLAEEDLAGACHEAGVKHGTTPRMVDEALAHRPNAKSARKLRAILRGEQKVTLSKLETRFLHLLRANDLPLPETNKPASGRRVDCRWPAKKLTVELDSYTYHSSRHAWERDRRREREAYARGDQFRRYTYGDVFEAQAAMLRELGGLLA